MPSIIYKIIRQEELAAAQQSGVFEGSSDDKRDGFIHFSSASQLAGSLNKHFSGESGLLIAAVDADTLGRDLKWEESRNGDLFPHLYRSISLSEFKQVRPVEKADYEEQSP